MLSSLSLSLSLSVSRLVVWQLPLMIYVAGHNDDIQQKYTPKVAS